MPPAHRVPPPAHHGAAAAPHLKLSVSGAEVQVSVQGKLGFDCWRALVEARQLAADRHLPLRVEVARCEEADMAGIGSLLIAIAKLGSIEMAGCTERSRDWFHNFGICRGCTAFGKTCSRQVH